jgi:hypothetical protein
MIVGRSLVTVTQVQSLYDREERVPSSLLFAGLVATWLAVLVPMAARRRQPMTRPSDAALSCRVLERPRRRDQEVSPMDDASTGRGRSGAAASPSERRDAGREPGWDPGRDAGHGGEWRPAPRFRRGRGGYDAEAAEAAAQAKYVFRQRMVLGLLLAAVASGLFAGGLGLAEGWYVHVSVDACLVGYLAYLRRQVRVEHAIRARRAARMAGTRVGVSSGTRAGGAPSAIRANGAPGGSRLVDSWSSGKTVSGARSSGETVSGGRSSGERVDGRPSGERPGSTDSSLDELIPDSLGLTRYSHVPEPRRRRGPSRRRRTVADEVAARAAEATPPWGPEPADGRPAEPHHEPSAVEVTDDGETEAEALAADLDADLAEEPGLPRLAPTPLPERPRGTVVLELDDEDPELHDLDSRLHRGYRRAAGQ